MKWNGSTRDSMPFYAPALSTILAKMVAVPASLPFEIIATRKHGGLSFGKFFRTDVLFYTFAREVCYSVAFWTVNEHLYKYFRKYTDVVNATTAAALFSGVAGGIASYPMDVIRTWKNNYPECFNNSNVVKVTYSLTKERGLGFVLAGNVL